jgi:hypothetical protein
LLAACTVQGGGQSTQPLPGVVNEQPDLANAAAMVTATLALTVDGQPAAALPAGTPELAATGIAICDRASPGRPIDVTVVDGTAFRPGDIFTKTWRLVNSGECIWTENYALVWFSGDPMGSARIQFLDEPVKPGESVDLSIEMIAPRQNGYYQSNWKMRNADGQLFGLGPRGDAPFWARIRVSGSGTPTPFLAPTKTPMPMIYQQGELVFTAGTRLDVDSGSLETGETDDFEFRFENEEAVLVPLEGVLLGVVENGALPSQGDCHQTPLSAEPVALVDLTREAYFCFESNQGLPGYLWLRAHQDDAASVTAMFVTWFVP